MSSYLLNDVYIKLFGPLVTFEGDTISLLMHLSSLLCRNKLQIRLSMISSSIMVFNIVYYIYYSLFSSNARDEALKFLTGQITSFHFFVSYCLMYIFATSYLKVRNLYLKNYKPIFTGSDEVTNSIQKESRLAIKFAWVLVAAVVVNVTLFLPWTGDEEDFIFILNRFKLHFGNDSLGILLQLGIFFTIYHAAYVAITPMFIVIYYMLQIKFQLALLIEKVERLNLIESKNLSKFVTNDVNHQRKIKRRLVSCIRHHQFIKRFQRDLGERIYWPTFILASSVLLFETSLLIFYLSNVCPSSNYRILYSFAVTILQHVVFGFVGETVVEESERLYVAIKCCNWYNWDKKNCRLLEIFLNHTQEPMAFTSSGIIGVSKELIAKSFKVLYSAITFYHSMSNNRSMKQ